MTIDQEQLIRHSYECGDLAFEGPETPDRGYTVTAHYLKAPNAADALVEIFKDGEPVRHFLFPAYKVWNIPAHFTDIVDGEIENSSRGYEMAAWNGLLGVAALCSLLCYPPVWI